MHVDGRKVNNRSFALALQAAGYQTALFGKYLNNWPWKRYVPLGFDAFLGNGGGSYIAPKFVAKGVHDLLSIPDGRWQAPAGSYSTAILGNATLQSGHANSARRAALSPRRPWFVPDGAQGSARALRARPVAHRHVGGGMACARASARRRVGRDRRA